MFSCVSPGAIFGVCLQGYHSKLWEREREGGDSVGFVIITTFIPLRVKDVSPAPGKAGHPDILQLFAPWSRKNTF